MVFREFRDPRGQNERSAPIGLDDCCSDLRIAEFDEDRRFEFLADRCCAGGVVHSGKHAGTGLLDRGYQPVGRFRDRAGLSLMIQSEAASPGDTANINSAAPTMIAFKNLLKPRANLP